MYLFHHSVDVTYSFRLVISFILSALYGYIVQFSCLFVSDSLRSNVCQGSLSITNSRSPPKPMSIESMMPSNHLILCCPLLLLPSIFPASGSFPMSQLFASDGQNTGVSASTSVLPINTQDRSPLGWTGWILQSKGLKSLLQHHSSKASILRHSAVFIVQLSHPYMTTGKTIALTRWTFIGKVMSLLFNTLSRLVITFLPGSKCLLISWLQSSSAVILEPRKIKSATVSTRSC